MLLPASLDPKQMKCRITGRYWRDSEEAAQRRCSCHRWQNSSKICQEELLYHGTALPAGIIFACTFHGKQLLRLLQILKSSFTKGHFRATLHLISRDVVMTNWLKEIFFSRICFPLCEGLITDLFWVSLCSCFKLFTQRLCT